MQYEPRGNQVTITSTCTRGREQNKYYTPINPNEHPQPILLESTNISVADKEVTVENTR